MYVTVPSWTFPVLHYLFFITFRLLQCLYLIYLPMMWNTYWGPRHTPLLHYLSSSPFSIPFAHLPILVFASTRYFYIRTYLFFDLISPLVSPSSLLFLFYLILLPLFVYTLISLFLFTLANKCGVYISLFGKCGHRMLILFNYVVQRNQTFFV